MASRPREQSTRQSRATTHHDFVRRAFTDLTRSDIVLTVTDHRQHITHLLTRIDDLQRRVVEWGVIELEAGDVDTATLLARFADRLRASDDALRAVVTELQKRID